MADHFDNLPPEFDDAELLEHTQREAIQELGTQHEREGTQHETGPPPKHIPDEWKHMIEYVFNLMHPGPQSKKRRLSSSSEAAVKQYFERKLAAKCAQAILDGLPAGDYRPYCNIHTSTSFHLRGLDYYQDAVPFTGTPIQIKQKARAFYSDISHQIQQEMSSINRNTDRWDWLKAQRSVIEARIKMWH